MVKYVHSPGVITQRDIRLHGFDTLRAGLVSHQDDIAPEEAVLAVSFRGGLFEINTVGALLWETLQAPTTLKELADVLMDLFEVEAVHAEADAGSFLEAMVGRGLVRAVPDDAPAGLIGATA